KSKILHDWANGNPNTVVFLKDEPSWQDDWEKEIPFKCKALIVDDAHRQASIGRVLQLVLDTTSYRNLKLIVSTRPGGAKHLFQEIIRKFDATQVMELPELQQLNKQQSRSLACQV